MTLFYILLTVIVAAILNGSYAFSLKYMEKWPEEILWFVFSIFGMIILPLVCTFLLVPNVLSVIGAIPTKNLILIIIGGLIFGIGQVCYSAAYKFIGISLNGVINISIGTSCTALAGLVIEPSLIGSAYSFLQFLGIIVFIVAVILGAMAGHLRTKSEHELQHDNEASGCITMKGAKFLIIGIVFAAFAGIGVAAEGVSYTISNPGIENALQVYNITGASVGCISWTIMYMTAWIPFGLYFLALGIKNKNMNKIFQPGIKIYWLYIVIMAICYFVALVIFSKASILIGGNLAPTVAWPLFMIFIILTTNFWGYIQGEWENACQKAFKILKYSIALLILAVIVFSISSAVL